MSLLIVHLPPHPRWHPARVQTPASEAEASVAEVDFVFSEDGQHVDERGRVAPALLPGLLDSYEQVYAAIDFTQGALSAFEKGVVWMVVVAAGEIPIGGHHVRDFRKAGGSVAQIEAAAMLGALAIGARQCLGVVAGI